MTVTVTRGKIHFAVCATHVFTQGLFHYAHRLDELAPIHRAKETKAADAVAHRDLISCLLLVLRLNQTVDRQTALGESLLDPGERHCQGGALTLKAAGKFRDKRALQRRV
ncbi:MAG: hypothetical protein M0Z61_03825 [Nitrospiraceae bacterium]|nr:hypothetical protein [Nitrospiraceae bacterium]